MSAPIIWIGLPGLTAIVLWFIRKDERRTLIAGISTSLFFILTSSFVPVGRPIIRLGEFAIQISPSISLLGRSFTLGNGDLVFTSLIFVILFLFVCMAFVIDVPVKFVPIGFLLTSLILAALSVQPFLYAALLLEICVILAVILVSTVGKTPTNGVMRFLIFQSLAMPFMLASGWVLSAVQANPTEVKLVLQALILLGLGFSFWMGIFPFNSWMTQIAGEKPPFETGFILLLFNTATLILIMRYLDGFVWLRDDARIFTVLRLMGVLTVVSSSLFFLLEKNVYRTIAYLISFETGLSLLLLSLNQSVGWNAFVLMFLPRIFAIALWSVLLTFVQQFEQQEESPTDKRLHPIVLVGFSIAAFTIGGLPILPGFVSRISLFSELAKIDFPILIWVCLANIIFIAASLRFITLIYAKYSFDFKNDFSRIEKGYFYTFTIIIMLIGFVPQLFFKLILTMLQAFPNLK